jgi:CelD/BcsL family acetyltransferase involved in cellulose biosynthesis
LIDALTRAGVAVSLRPTQEVCVTELDGDFESYERGFSRNHRRSIRRNRRRLERDGGARLEMVEDIATEDVADLLLSGFEIEHRCWKGREGTSVLATSGMLGYYLNEAAMLARRGELALVFLVHRGQRIAFQYAYRSRGHYFLPKHGYDEAYAHYSPGNVLTYELMRHLCLERAPVRVDFHGESGPASVPWRTQSHRVGTIAIGNRRVLGPAIVWSYGTARRLRRTVRSRRPHRAPQ